MGTCKSNQTVGPIAYLNQSADMTIPRCKKLAASKGYVYAALQWDRWCYGINDINGSTNDPAPRQCIHRCAGDPSQFCGGWCLSAIYRLGESAILEGVAVNMCICLDGPSVAVIAASS